MERSSLRPWLAALLLLACHTDRSREMDADASWLNTKVLDASSPGVSDAGTPPLPPGVTACTVARPSQQPATLPLPDGRKAFFEAHPLATLKSGGWQLELPRLVGVFFPDDPLRPDTLAFLKSYGCTRYWRDAVDEYLVGDAVYSRTVDLPGLDVNGDAPFDADEFRTGSAKASSSEGSVQSPKTSSWCSFSRRTHRFKIQRWKALASTMHTKALTPIGFPMP